MREEDDETEKSESGHDRGGRDDAMSNEGSASGGKGDGGSRPSTRGTAANEETDAAINHLPGQRGPSCDEGGEHDGDSCLGDVHRGLATALGVVCVEGGPLWARPLRRRHCTEYYSLKNVIELLLFVFAFKHQLSRVALSDLFAVLGYVDGEQGDDAGER